MILRLKTYKKLWFKYNFHKESSKQSKLLPFIMKLLISVKSLFFMRKKKRDLNGSSSFFYDHIFEREYERLRQHTSPIILR